MAKYEFRFVVTGIELSDHVQEQISSAIAEAGALALGEHNPPMAVSFPVGRNIWWRGIPPPEVTGVIEQIIQGGQATA